MSETLNNIEDYENKEYEKYMIATIEKYEKENDDFQFGHEIEQQILNDYL